MDRSAVSWLRDFWRHFLLYVAAGTAFLPAAVVYGFLRSDGRDHWLLATAALIAGLGFAAVVWSRMRLRLVGKQVTRPEEPMFEPRVQIQASQFVTVITASSATGAVGIMKAFTAAPAVSPKIQIGEAAQTR